MVLTDTHAHLYTEAFDADRDEVMARARAAGVERFFLPAIDSSYDQAMKLIKAAYPDSVFLMTGLHPSHVGDSCQEELDRVEASLDKGGYVAVGEIGIDLYWDTSRLQDQIRAFRRQIRLAIKHDLPIVIHCRDAFEEIFEVLESERHERLRGIFHCFTGTFQQAEKAISLNMKLGIGGVVTFKNGKIDQFLSQVALDHIVLETDAPYLAPAPHRGKRNESSYIRFVAKRLAELYGISEEEIARVTTENSKAVFGC
ncbi:MAG: TatD family deoxyribonuclease [Bacteroidetes bacterium]|jgi:TatD DNase family protein|nr:MAG: TatD family deoxyribonuclease [Bacteroidota bacterium]UCE68479.1 MAG: TatD family hydrolase [Flavobacteriaceae bacterium]